MSNAKEIIDNLELRVFILTSITLQIILIIWAYQRKRSSAQPVGRIVWLAAYMAADFTATLTLGGIFQKNMNPNASNKKNAKNMYLLALWAPFILLHLGGHSKMTAFSLADNEFWLSHVFRFLYHELTALFICILASTERQFRLPSSILFIIGTVKFGERVLALKRGSMNELRSSTFKTVDPGPTIQEFFQLAGNNETQIPANRRGDTLFGAYNIEIVRDPGPQLVVHSRNRDVRTLCAAYQSFNKNKDLYVDAIFTHGDGIDEGHPFAQMTIGDTFDLMEMELSFAHDLFYTKTALSHTHWRWIIQFLSLISIGFTTWLFKHIDKNGFLQPDVGITYSLLVIALILETLNFLETITSIYTLIQVGFEAGRGWRFAEGIIRGIRHVVSFPRQSTLVGQFSVLSYCFHDSRSSLWKKWLLKFFQLKDIWDNYHYTHYVSIDANVERKIRIFNRLKARLEEGQAQRGHDNNIFSTLVSQSVSRQIRDSENEICIANITNEYEECLLIWHIATDLCYRTEAVVQPFSDHLQDAKFLSDYMLYLLAMQPSMVSSVATTELTSYRIACATSIQLYSDFRTRNDDAEVYTTLQQINNILLTVPEEFRDRANTLLLEGFKVASALRKLQLNGNREPSDARDQWELLFQLWVDMLSYAAWQCKGKQHADQLGSGGQFLTYVWLFMIHLIRDSHYEIDIENVGGP